jgi:hypothetical protein
MAYYSKYSGGGVKTKRLHSRLYWNKWNRLDRLLPYVLRLYVEPDYIEPLQKERLP